VTNNAGPSKQVLQDRLRHVGIETEPEDVVTSAQAAASMLRAGQTAFVCGETGVNEALTERGLEVLGDLDPGTPVDAVVVGWTDKFDFRMLSKSMSAVRSGARLIGCNEDPTHPIFGGLTPGAGSMLASVATASETKPEVAGKPYEPMAALVRGLAPEVSAVVGDRPSTDGLFARKHGVPYGLVYTGVTPADHGKLEQQPDIEAEDLAAVVDRALAR